MNTFSSNLRGFPIAADNVIPLASPSDFYDELISRTKTAHHRIVLSSLYLGNGKLERELVSTLEEALSSRTSIQATVLLDYLRGTRGVAEGKSSACLLRSVADKAQVYLYHTPFLKGFAKRYLPERTNEIVGLQHMKIYIFDDNVIISGANLSDSYFTNRQDRYVLFRNCKQLADYLEKIVLAVGQNSFQLKADGTTELHPSCKSHPFQGSEADYVANIQQQVNKILQEVPASPKNETDTTVYPLVQMGPFGILQEHDVLKKILSSNISDFSITMASGYFNCVDEYEELMLAKSSYPLKIITASPAANGFYGASGATGYVPCMYSWVAEKFLEKAERHKRQNVELFEYYRQEWTFHAKGLWLETHDKSATIVGSSNYGYRSLNRDLEAQVLLITSNEQLRARLADERSRLFDYSTVLDGAAMKKAEHQIPIIVRIVSRMAGFAVAVSILMVVTGSLNTICAKWADSLKDKGVAFNHPFLQATCMFFGEFLCLIVFFMNYAWKKYQWRRLNISGNDGAGIINLSSDSEPALPQFSPLVFLPPACCDILATSIMYIGLNLTTASSFQMLRGAVIIFTGLLSVGMLGQHIKPFKWFGMLFVMLGLIVVGVTDIIYDDNPMDDKNAIITGNLLIIMAQIIVAIQMVYEQKYLHEYNVPALFAVGLEGLFGMTILIILMFPFYYIHVPHTFSTNPDGRLEDVFYAWEEIKDVPTIALALSGTVVSIAFFNFAGVTVTKELSATTRMVLDSVRTLVIWAVSIPLFGEKFIAMQLIGFALLILGMVVYNDIALGPYFRRNVLPNMGENNMFTRCCFQICGADVEEGDRDSLLAEDREIDG